MVADVTNWIILEGLKTRLDESKDRWLDELPGVLWTNHMTPYTSTNKTPFNLIFDTEVVILIEIELSTMRIEHFKESSNIA